VGGGGGGAGTLLYLEMGHRTDFEQEWVEGRGNSAVALVTRGMKEEHGMCLL